MDSYNAIKSLHSIAFGILKITDIDDYLRNGEAHQLFVNSILNS